MTRISAAKTPRALVMVLILLPASPMGAVESALQVFTGEDRRLIEQGFRGGIRYHPIPGEALEDPHALLAPDESAAVFRVIPESGPETEETHRFFPVSDVPGHSNIEYRLNEAEAQIFSHSEAYGVAIEGAIDRNEGVRTEFQPAKPLIPRGLMPGQSAEKSVKVRVLDLEHPEKVKHSGELSVTLTHLGSFHVVVPFGEFESVLLRLESHGKIGPATILHRQYYFFAEDAGLLAFLESRSVSAFGIYERQQRDAMVLVREVGT